MSETDFDYIRQLVRQKASIFLKDEKQSMVEARLLLLAQQEKMGSVLSLLGKLRSDPTSPMSSKAIEMIIPQDTGFFRGISTFDLLRKDIIPELILKREKEKSLSFWCGACASGQEAYSIALLIRHFFPDLLNWKIRILGTDLLPSLIERARQGLFNQIEVYRGLTGLYFPKYFSKKGKDWQISKDLQEMVEFEAFDLAGLKEGKTSLIQSQSFDVIFIRNIMIYFEPVLQEALFRNLPSVLKQDGYLFLGEEENVLDAGEWFRKVQKSMTYYFQLKAGEAGSL